MRRREYSGGAFVMTFKIFGNGAWRLADQLPDAILSRNANSRRYNNPQRYETFLQFNPDHELVNGAFPYKLKVRIVNKNPEKLDLKSENWFLEIELEHRSNSGFSIVGVKGKYQYEQGAKKKSINIPNDHLEFIFKSLDLAVRAVDPPKLRDDYVEVSSDLIEEFLPDVSEESMQKDLTDLADRFKSFSDDPDFAIDFIAALDSLAAGASKDVSSTVIAMPV